MKIRARCTLGLGAGVLGVAAILGGCNTVSGVGQDLKDASDATKKAIVGSDSSPKTDSTNTPSSAK